MKAIQTLFLLSLFFSSCESKRSIPFVEDLKVEYQNSPLGIDIKVPILSWKLKSNQRGKQQSAYQIIVSQDNRFEDKSQIVWNTKKTKSSKSIGVHYNGQPLRSNITYFWKVKIWDESDTESDFSQVNSFQTGMFDEKDWSAKWISNKFKDVTDTREPFTKYDDNRTFESQDSSAVYMRKVFDLPEKPKKATLFISGLGYFEAYLNGDKIGNEVLNPVFTDYQRNVKYLSYNLTKQLGSGQNAFGVILGNGFYNHTERDLFQMEKANWKTPPKLLFQLHLEYENGKKDTLISDESWQWTYGPIVYNSIRGGETIDARIDIEGWNTSDYNSEDWENVVEVPKPIGKLTYQRMPPLRETKTLQPDSSWSPKENITVFDFGENITGYTDVRISGTAGTVVKIAHNEVLNTDGTLNKKHSSGHTWGRFQMGKLILSDAEVDVFEPRFTYHGFRYVQVEGVPTSSIKSIKAQSVHTDLKEISTFECSNKRLNQLHSAVKRTLLNSVHSMPGEEATREKMGWTYDGGMNTMESYFYNFDAINTYKKYLDDLVESQESNGHVPPIVPTNGWGFLEKTETQKDTTVQYDDPFWGGTLNYVAQELYEQTGDSTVITENYESLKAYTDFVLSTAEDHIVFWSLGDWLDLEHNKNGWGPGLTSVALTSTAGLYYLCQLTVKHAELSGKQKDAKTYRKIAEKIKNAYNKKFLDEKTGWYDKHSQTGQAVSLFYDLVPDDLVEKAEQRLIEAIKANNDHTSVGFIGVRPLQHYLSQNGYKDLMYRLVTQEESPGWLHFVKDERSTMGENLNAEGYGTNHHPFATNIGFWLFEYLNGVQMDYTLETPFHLNPGLETDLEWCNVTIETLYGTVVSNWKKTANGATYNIGIPVNAAASLKLPDSFVLKNQDDYEQFITKQGDFYQITSGTYNLNITKNPN